MIGQSSCMGRDVDYIQGHAEEIGKHRNAVSEKDAKDCMGGKENK